MSAEKVMSDKTPVVAGESDFLASGKRVIDHQGNIVGTAKGITENRHEGSFLVYDQPLQMGFKRRRRVPVEYVEQFGEEEIKLSISKNNLRGLQGRRLFEQYYCTEGYDWDEDRQPYSPYLIL